MSVDREITELTTLKASILELIEKWKTVKNSHAASITPTVAPTIAPTFSGERPTFILDEQFRMRGFGGCNTFAATAYPLRQQKFAVGPFALPTPRKSCEKAITEQENNFLIALRTSIEWDSVLGILVVKTQNGELKFERSI